MTGSRLLLADARGTVWAGSAVVVLASGKPGGDASRLPGRLHWSAGWALASDGSRDEGETTVPRPALAFRVRHACCIDGALRMLVRPGAIAYAPEGELLGQWPLAWLHALGAPWNALQLQGTLRLSASDFSVGWPPGSRPLGGRLTIEVLDVASPASPLPVLGSYRVAVEGSDDGAAALTLSTDDGALQLSGSGTWDAAGLHFKGEASADDDEEALRNVLELLGTRNGSRSLIAIG